MSGPWKHTDTVIPADERELDPELQDAIEAVLDIAASWAAGELPTPEAFRLATAEPRAIGNAFRFSWADERRPALERLHMHEYGQRYGLTYTNFGWVTNAVFEQVCRNNEWRRTTQTDERGQAA